MQDAPAFVDPIPRCSATHVVRNGHARPKKGPVPAATQDLVRRLLAERMALRAIARAVGVSRSWLQGFVNPLYREETP